MNNIPKFAYPSFQDFYFACDMSIRLRQEGMCGNDQAAEAGFLSYQAYLKTQLAKSKEQLVEEMRAEINEKKFFTAHPLVIPKDIIIPNEGTCQRCGGAIEGYGLCEGRLAEHEENVAAGDEPAPIKEE